MSEDKANGAPVNLDAALPAPWSRRLTACVVALVLLGVGWRLTRYLLQFPIWGDEAHIALNILDRDYRELMQPLRFVQAAPLLFLWLQRAAFDLLGGSELSLRLLSLLGGVGGLLLFARLAWRLMPGLPAALAIGILAVAYYPVRHSCEVKPYGVDLFVSVALLTLAAEWLHAPRRWHLALLTLFVPVALGASYPAAFIAGTVSLALLPGAWRGDGKTRALYVAYNVAMLAGFLGFYLLVGTGQYQSEGGSDNYFYSEWFPPAQPVALVRWLLAVHTGTMLAYPVGGHSGGSTLTALLCLAGIVGWWRRRQWAVLVLCLAPFALTLIAAMLHRYPYGGSARYEQHLAPVICLLAGSGAAWLIEWLTRAAPARQLGTVGALVLLATVGLVGLGRDLFKPYKTEGDQTVRQVLRDIVAQAGPEDQVVVMDPVTYMAPPMEWYLRRLGKRIAWEGQVDWERLGQQAGRLWSLYFSRDPERTARLEAEFSQRAIRPLQLAAHAEHWMQMGWGWDTQTRKYCEFYEWRPAAAE
jgi:4-amino-4-deoxy-L-arabinose transferase-like glycosyltransferase